MQSVNGAQFLNTTSLYPLFGLSSTYGAVDIVPVCMLCMHHYNDIEVLTLIRLSLLYVPRASSFISTQLLF